MASIKLNTSNLDFNPPDIRYQSDALNILLQDNYSTLAVRKLDALLQDEPYLNIYLKNLINKDQNFFQKFITLYQCLEILIGKLLGVELKNKICNESSSRTGYQIKNTVYEISKESYRINKVLNHYCTYQFESDYHIGAEIYAFFEKHFSELINSKSDLSNLLYELRNQLVHNYRTIIHKEENQRILIQEDLKTLVNQLEFLVAEVIVSIDFSK